MCKNRPRHGCEVVGVDADIDHATALGPTIVDVTVQEPLALVDWASVRESVLFLAVYAVPEVAQQHTMLAENDMG